MTDLPSTRKISCVAARAAAALLLTAVALLGDQTLYRPSG